MRSNDAYTSYLKRQVEKTPGLRAVVYEDQYLTYRDLNDQAKSACREDTSKRLEPWLIRAAFNAARL